MKLETRTFLKNLQNALHSYFQNNNNETLILNEELKDICETLHHERFKNIGLDEIIEKNLFTKN